MELRKKNKCRDAETDNIWKKSQNETELHLFVLSLGEYGEKQIELKHTETTNTFFENSF